MNTDIVISQADGRPMYLQIMDQIRLRIALGDWPAGQKIPSIRDLAVGLRVSVITVKRAYLELERQGALVTRQGLGSFVAESGALDTLRFERELDQHLRESLEIAGLLGLTLAELISRLQTMQGFHVQSAKDEHD